MKFIWIDEYSVGIPSIDKQHQHFFEIANTISGLNESNAATREDLLKAAEELGDYALYHLKTEEDYFEKFHYAGAELHIAVHNDYRKRVTEYLEAIRNEQGDLKQLSQQIADFSTGWLSQHILKMDKLYTEYLKSQGVV